jgi:BolA-like protein 1
MSRPDNAQCACPVSLSPHARRVRWNGTGFCAPASVSTLATSSLRVGVWVPLSGTVPLRNVPSLVAKRRASAIVAVDAALHLPVNLGRLVDTFAAVPDSKLRYQQLLFFARKLPEMDEALKTEENRVRGCTSVVHVDVRLDENDKVQIAADSDAQLTKGLVALLVNGLAGCTVDEVLAIDPSFINASGLSVSLTPSRNNGFINMVAKIKERASALGKGVAPEAKETRAADEKPPVGGGDIPGRPMYSAILRKMQVLAPTEIVLKDNSAAHAKHSAAMGIRVKKDGSASEASEETLSPETHFAIRVVSDAFEGLSLVKRHRVVYTLLRDEMENIHALNISATTTAEELATSTARKK